jgi:hypothetical protein
LLFLLDAREELLGAYWVGQTIHALRTHRLVIEPGIAMRFCIQIDQAFLCRRVRLASQTPPYAIPLSVSDGHTNGPKKTKPPACGRGSFLCFLGIEALKLI